MSIIDHGAYATDRRNGGDRRRSTPPSIAHAGETPDAYAVYEYWYEFHTKGGGTHEHAHRAALDSVCAKEYMRGVDWASARSATATPRESPLGWVVFVHLDPQGYDYRIFADEQQADDVAGEDERNGEPVPLYRASAFHAVPTEAEHAGRKTVPINPDDPMLVAARDWSLAKYGKSIGDDAAIGCWKAMLAAAPVLDGPKERDKP